MDIRLFTKKSIESHRVENNNDDSRLDLKVGDIDRRISDTNSTKNISSNTLLQSAELSK